MKVHHWLASGLLILLALSLQIGEAQSETAPFIYYYSDSLRTFVIERADGADSRVLSAVMPSGTEDVRIVGWSPSGQWLAWTSSNDVFGNYTPSSRGLVWVANVDGARRLDLLKDVRNAYDITWSPIEDLLFVSDVGQVDAGSNFNTVSTHRFFLIDAQTQNAITTFEIETSPADRGYGVWTADGQYVAFEYTVRREDHLDSFIRRISRTGVIEDISIPSPLRGGGDLTITITRPPGTWILVRSEDFSQFIAVNVASGETIEFNVPSPIVEIFLYQWNYTGEYVLLYVGTPEPEAGFELWLISIVDRTLQLIARNAGNFAVEATSRQPSWFPWSLYANNAIFLTDEGLYGLEIDPEVQIFQITSAQIDVFSPEWYVSGDRVYFSAFEVDLAANTGKRVASYVYDFLSNTLTEQDSRFSPYLSSVDEHFTILENPLAVLDRVQNLTYLIPPDSRTENGFEYHLEYVHWHRNEPWMITAEIFSERNDGYDRLYMSLNDVYGTAHRELGSCYSFCAAWLPEQVAAHVESQ